ncbi:transcriptional regulator [Micromonospora sp. CPCC 206061]|uniref:transcriptional regulator n=1 Tax=Micromonospora sp. CPCC 206061 TaxID=3122410 RepID=UPI002FF29806
MLADPSSKLGMFGAVFAALYAAHQVADHWVQTQWQADTKGQPGWLGRLACAAHVATYTLTAAIGMTVSAVSHYIADRRTPLARIAAALGSARFHAFGAPRPGRDDNPTLGTGAYALDQAWHVGFLFVAALWIAGGAS